MNAKRSLKEELKNPDSVRMFKNDFLEKMSHVHPITPFVIYIPVVLYSMYYSIFIQKIQSLQIVLYLFLGIIVWTFIEYLLHRILFHIPQTTKIKKVLYDYSHGMHHDKPHDASRLVMPPGASLPLAVIIFFTFRALAPLNYLPFFTGFLVGYLFYDFLHFATHFLQFKGAYFKSVKRNHMIHHYRAPLKNFGFTSPLWDFVFFSKYKKGDAGGGHHGHSHGDESSHEHGEDFDDTSGLNPL